MCASGILDLGNALHMECLWFCFNPLIARELENVKLHWNTHRIRSSKQQGTVSGIPDVMYYLPQRTDAVDCKFSVTEEKVQEMEQKLDFEEQGNSYEEYFYYAMDNENLRFPVTSSDGFELFQKLIALACP